ncbi:MAG: FAD-binding protein [Pseudolysinimonas sp.]
MNLDTLSSTVSGTVLRPDDDAFIAAIGAYLGNPPAIVVRASTEEDVAAAVSFAVASGLGVAVRSGGHGGPMYSPGSDRLLIDLAALNSISVDETGVTTIGPGAVWSDVASALQPSGYAVTSGDTADVGVGGLALGGGIGWLVRRDGLTIDNLISARVVTAAGELVTASADENPELFWALRGGGGNFGVVTSFTVQAHPLDGVLHATATIDPDQIDVFLRGWRDAMRAAPDQLNGTFTIAPLGPTGPVVHELHTVWAGADSAEGRAALAPLLALPGVLSSEVTATGYRNILIELPAPPPGAPMPTIAGRNALVADFDDATIDAALAVRGKVGMSVFAVRYLGGQFSRVSPDATAFAARDSEAIVNIVEFLPPGTPATSGPLGAAWSVAGFRATQYGNFTTEIGDAVVATMYPSATLARLRAVKKQYDPANLFSGNLNVAPA